jgi:hypothetical protein
MTTNAERGVIVIGALLVINVGLGAFARRRSSEVQALAIRLPRLP